MDELDSFFSVNKTFLANPLKKHSTKTQLSQKLSKSKPSHCYSQKFDLLLQKITTSQKSLCENIKKSIKQYDQIKKNQSQHHQEGIELMKQKIKTQSLKFQYYYKNMKFNQESHRQAIDIADQQLYRGSSLKISKQFATNLNYQMLQNMKKCLRRVQKNKVSLLAQSFQNNTNFGLNIKPMKTRKKNYAEQFMKIKQAKRIAKSSLLVIKKTQQSTQQKINSKAQITTCKNNPIKLTNLINLNKQKSLKQQLDSMNKNQQKSLITRLQGMKMNLSLVLCSFKCQLQNEKIQNNTKFKKHTYFIGYGNNKNLIRSIMKKRWWWTQVYQVNDANFVWTQLKLPNLLDKMQEQTESIQQIKQAIQVMNPQQSIQTTNQNSINEFKTLDNIQKNKITLKNPQRTKINLKNLISSYQVNKISNLFHCNNISDIQKGQQNRFSQFSSENYMIKSSILIHNHYRLNYMFGNKNALFYNLKRYFQYANDKESLFSIVPKTYYLEKLNKSAIKEFYIQEFHLKSQSIETNNKKSKEIWIVKPAENSNRGQGITVHTKFQTIRKQICSSKNSGKFIVQKYLKNLFLYQRRKFDIRTYLIMITMGQTTKIFWYNEGYIRTSSQYYNTNDVQNIFVHLTNDAIQCQTWKQIKLSQFQRYLDGSFPNQKYSLQSLNKSMKQIAGHAVRAIYPRIKTNKVNYSFQLFGMDFLIDSDFKPWLIEINTNPCLQLGCPVLQRLIPRMLENMFRLCLDPVFQPSDELTKSSSYFIYENLIQINRFQVIFDSNYDSNYDWIHQCEQQGEIVYADDNDLFQNDGVEIELEG